MSLFGSLVGPFAMLMSVAGFQATTNDHEVGGSGCARLQGTWRIVSIECGGKQDNQDIDRYTIRFDGATMIFRECGGNDDGGDNDEAAVKYELGERQCSKQISFGGVSGIFDFKDGNLLICYSIEGDRPTELRTTTDRPEEVLMILKRTGQ